MGGEREEKKIEPGKTSYWTAGLKLEPRVLFKYFNEVYTLFIKHLFFPNVKMLQDTLNEK